MGHYLINKAPIYSPLAHKHGNLLLWDNVNTYKNDSFYAIITHMESGENLNTDINNNNTDFETANNWGSLTDDKSESIAAFAAHALQKTKARERIEALLHNPKQNE